MMKLFILLLLIVSPLVVAQEAGPLINYISGSPNTVKLPALSSRRGGALLYIQAVGHSQMASENLVFVGTFPCIIPADGVTETFITCETTDSGLNQDISNLQVVLFSKGISYTTASPNLVNYVDSSTPLLVELFPSSASANQAVNLLGIHRITNLGDGRDMGDVVKIKLGGDLCSRFDVVQANIPANSFAYIQCIASSLQVGGRYNVTEHLTPGIAHKVASIRRPSLVEGEYFEFTSLPTITSISPASGNLGGQVITLSGTGFSGVLANNSVSVDGNNCEVKSVTETSLVCTLGAKNPSASALLATTSSSQVNGYFAGAGLKYARYSVTSSTTISAFVDAVRTSNTAVLGTALQAGYRAQLKEGDVYGSNYGQTWKGYFTAPVTGDYTFRGVADNIFSFYISTVVGSAEPPASPLISSSTNQAVWSNYYYDDTATSEAQVTLTAGKSYYIEAYHINYASTGYFRIEVDVPNTNTKLPFQACEVDKISISSTIQPEVVNYTITGGSTGSINLKVARTDPSTGKITYNVNRTILYGCSAEDFQSALNAFDSFSSYRISVTRFIYDGSDNEILTTVGASKIVYQVSILLLRPDARANEDFTYSYLDGFTGTMAKSPVTSHSPIISGTFSLSIGGVVLDSLSYAITDNALQAKINTIVGYEQVSVDKVTLLGDGYDNTWIITYVGVNNAIPSVVVNGALLSGGSTSPTIQVTVRRAYSSAITFNPVDYRFLNTFDTLPSVLLSVNSVPAICKGDCKYSFIDATQITALSLSGGVLSMTIVNRQSTTIPMSAVTVQVQGLPCAVDNSATLASLTCTLSKNSDNSPTLVAGSFTPAVYISPTGFAALGSGVSAISVPLITSALGFSTGGNNGGYYNVLTGSGFPLDKSKITITICSNPATIISSSNIEVRFYMPACASTGVQSVTVAVGSSTSSSLTFTFTDGSVSAPIISSIAPPSHNPAIKGVLTISGTGFGNVAADIQVFLSNSSGKVYQLRVITANDTRITVGLSGGLPGVFTVQITLPNSVGNSIATGGADQFQYLCSITSISPTSGSYYGGTLLTITGNNFSPAYSDTLVYVGDTLNWFCNIQTVTATQITCRTPPFDVKRYVITEAQKVVISTKLYSFNTCPGNNCGFTYNDAATSPTLTKISTASAGSVNITLNGTNILNGACGVSLTSQANSSLVIPTSATCTSTSAVFKVPATVPSGNYFVKVRNDVGESNGLALKVNWVPGIPSYNGGGSVMGNIVTFSMGSGYPAQLGSGFNILVNIGGSNAAVNIVSCCINNVLSLALPPSLPTNAITITFKGPVGSYSTTYITDNAMTPSIVAPTTSFTPGANTVTFTRNDTINLPITTLKLVSAVDSTSSITITDLANTGSSYNFTATLNSGSYNILALTDYGYCKVSNPINVALAASVTGPSIVSSYAGGVYTITGNNLSPTSYIMVNGFKGKINTYTSTAVTYNIPPFITTTTQNTFKLGKVAQIDSSAFVYSSDKAADVSNASAAFDNNINTIYGSDSAVCFIRIDVGAGLQASVSRFRYFPYLGWTNTANKILDGVFEGSNDESAWQLLGTIDQTVHSGWNILVSKDTTPFRYFRFRHTNESQCNLAEIQLFGIAMSSALVTISSTQSSVYYFDGANTKAFSNAIEFRQDQTPVVQSVVPPYGDIFGNYNITISGTNLGFASATVLIDGVACAVASSTSTSIVCTVGARPAIPKTNTFKVAIGGSNAVIVNNFLYVLKWSDSRTWGVDLPPIEDDLVYVPPGMTLLIDQDTPILKGIAVEKGTLIFPNDTDVTVSTGFITMNGGTFLAGTESAPLHSKLTFIMYGEYYGKQQVMFGNKGIGCLNCKFSMYGKPRQPTWTTISATINKGDTSFMVSEDVDWVAGETIVVAATGFYHFEAEERKIKSISGRNITVDLPFEHKHVSVEESYGASDKLVMRAEVGLLSRNIKMMGDPTSEVAKYGSHLMLSGTRPDGLQGHVAYSEFTHCGQPQIVGRYCIHFHMAAEVPTSFVRGNAVHESFARVVTIHGVYLLTVQNNVGYRVRGHNFFIEDGIETHNTIRNNLAISSLAVTNMMQTDTSVASFWVTNPTNHFYGNHAAGGDFYGIWYEIKSNPDGPSATNDVCPIGNPLGYVANNVAHSNTRFGLRIFKLYSRKYPCRPVRDNTNASDPWFSNPSSPSIYHNFTIYKNLEAGVLSEQTGNVMFNNFTIAENYRAGVEFYEANFTREMVSVNNCAIIGQSQNNVEADTSNYTNGMAAVITPRTGQSNITNTRFYNYPSGSIAIITCSHCEILDLFTNIGTEVFVKNLTFDSVSGNYLLMVNMKRDIIYSLDASLALPFDGNGVGRSSATIVSKYNHIANYHQAKCTDPSELLKWDNTIMCDQTITIRRIFFTNAIDSNTFNAQFMKVKQLASMDEVIDPATVLNPALYTSITSRSSNKEPMLEKPKTWSLPFVTGQIYQVWWGTGLDFSHLSISSSPLFTAEDSGVIFKFNYTLNRELFDIGPMRGGVPLTSSAFVTENVDNSTLKAATCKNGEYFHNNTNSSARHLAICQSGKSKALFEYTEINSVICRYHCPAPAGTFVKEPFTRRWSNATQWPGGVMPSHHDNVTVNGNWTVILDMDPAPIDYLIVDGTLIADDTRDVNITARSIFIRAGNVTAGSPSSPFTHKFIIQINNTKEDRGWYIDPLVAGNKYLIVTGSLNLYGVAPSSVQTSLTEPALAGSKVIKVKDSAGWQVGDRIALSPSYGVYSQYEEAKITAINESGIFVESALRFNHYGSPSLLSTPYGSIDVNTHVGHLSRNISIIPGPDVGWGVNVLVYGFMDGKDSDAIRRDGSVNLQAVSIVDGGQYDTTASALQFLNIIQPLYPSTVTASSFINCKAWCVNIDNVRNVSFTNNVFYKGLVFGVQARTITNFQFTNNLIIGISAKPSVAFGGELIACFATYDYINPATDNVAIQNNFCLGSQGHGFALPHIKCSQLETNPFKGNTAGSCQIGFIFNNIPTSDQCKAFSYINVYASQIGNICGPVSTTSMVYKNFIMVDNQRGITLKFGNGEGTSNHTGVLTNSYVAAVSRPECADCYGSGKIDCSDNIGMRLLTVSANGESLPKKFGPGFDVICKQELYESKVYMTNVTFENFNQTYLGPVASQCRSNFVFRSHNIAFGAVADHNLFNVSLLNSDKSSYLLADENDPSQIGWFGGCGDILCTGKSNYLVVDWTGGFLGFNGTIVPNNTVFGQNERDCVFNSAMNAHICTRNDIATLAYQSVAPDFNTRIMWPVSLKYDGGNYTTLTNAWREWDWLGKEPQNKRFGRFLSLVKLNSTYNFTFTAMPPVKMQYQIQKRKPLGISENYIVAKIHYPMPNMIQVKVNGVVMDPVLITDSGLKRPLNKSLCGDNVYFYTNYTSHFVVTEDLNCLVNIALTDTIQLTTHFAMNASDFFTNTAQSTFISNLCALLGITDTSRVKIVGVVTGSTIVTTSITDTGSTSGTNATNGTGGSTLTQITAILAANSTAVGASLGTALGTTTLAIVSAYYPVYSTSSDSSSSSSNLGMIVGAVVAGVVLIVLMVFVFFYCLRKRAKIVEEIRQSEEEFHHDKQLQKDHNFMLGQDSLNIDPNNSHSSEFKINQNSGVKVAVARQLNE